MLPELLEKLERGEIPKYTYKKTLFDAIRYERYRNKVARTNALNNLQLIRPKAIKTVIVKDISISGHIATIDGIYITKYNSDIKSTTIFENKATRPTVRQLSVEMDGVSKGVYVLFGAKATYTIELTKKITSPQHLNVRARVYAPLLQADEVTQKYTIGLLDNRAKPVSEYPVQGVDNAVLDIAYSWKEGVAIYPSNVPTNKISIKPYSTVKYDGFYKYDIYYKLLDRDNKVTVKWIVTYNGSKYLDIHNYGVLVSVLYDDLRHVSSAVADVKLPNVRIGSKMSYNFSATVTLPPWAYGYVAIVVAQKFFEGGMPIYYGGPMWTFKVGRVLLP